MSSAARVRSVFSPSGASLLGALLCLTAAPGCGDDGSPTLSGTGGSSGTTTGDTSSTSGPTGSTSGTASAEGSTTATTDATSSTSTGDATTSSSSGSSTTEGDSSSSSSSTGASFVDVPFIVLDPSALELTARVPEGWVVVTTAAQWATFTDAPVPDGVTFPTQWVLFGSRGPQAYPGHALTVSALAWQGDTLRVSGDHVDPADDCETYDFIWPADSLVAFDALDSTIEDVDDQTAVLEVSCAGGAANTMGCDLDVPCATGLLCAGIIRNTVLANSPGGLCLTTANRGTFTGTAVTIPTDGAVAEITMEVAGLSTVDMDVTILLEHDHPAPEELLITLRNPDNNTVSVANLQSTEFHPGGVPIVPTGFSGDESVNGTWTLIVQDTVDNANNGSVQSWELEIMSRLD